MSDQHLKNSTYPPVMYLENNNDTISELEMKGSDAILTKNLDLGKSTKKTYCACCKRNVWSRIESKSGVFTYLCSGYICIIGGVLGCCLIPYCCRPCKDTYHYCSNCDTPLGVSPVL